MSEPTITIEPLPCFVCGKLPKVDSFLLMDLYHHGWSCLCPSKCYETETYYERAGAVEEWNRWVESEGFDDFEDYDEDMDEEDDETDAGGGIR